MDLSRRPGDAIAAVSAAALFVFLFVDWALGLNGWELFDVVDIVLTAIAVVVFVLAAAALSGQRLALPIERGRLITYLGAAAIALIAAFILEFDDLKVGIFLDLLAAIGIVYAGTRISREPASPGTAATAPGGTAPPRA